MWLMWNILLSSKGNCKNNHKCDPCGKSFTQSGVLNRHILSMSKRHACEKDFSLWIFYLVFVEVHHGQKDHNCDSCGITFAQPHNGELSVILILPP